MEINALHKGWHRVLPEFLRTDYSPYQCHVSANRENYDWRAKKVHLQNMLKTWFNTGKNPFLHPVECQHCLFDTRIPNIYIGADGLCNMCMTYKRNFDPEILKGELDTFMSTPREPGATLDAVVAFSGGKDSTVSLYLARKKYNLNVAAVLIDNGFIPQAVIEKGRAVCQQMGVELVVRQIDFVPHVKRMLDTQFQHEYPCYVCTAMFHEEIRKFCLQHRINRVILGRNWWRWLEPEVRAVRWVKDETTGFQIQFLSFPFALQLTETSVKQLLQEISWSPVAIHGNSTNCLIPGLVAYSLYQRLGYHPELNLLSREVICGYLSKEQAKEELKQVNDLTGELRRLVEEKCKNAGTGKAGER